MVTRGGSGETEMASVMLEQVAYLIPLEPHLTQLLRAVIFAVDHVKTLCADGMPMPTVWIWS